MKKKKSDATLLLMLNKKHALTQPELERHLGYCSQGLGKRLVKLVENKELHCMRIPKNSGMHPYGGTKLYYTTRKNLMKWVELRYKHLRKKISHNIRIFDAKLIFKIVEKK